ncbi:MAG: Hsp20/alpha crystallin family protein [Acidimicrobiia bacterium]|nr:Hsp20/alpha crystallin family protein [Acidimicrobiia bacterium]
MLRINDPLADMDRMFNSFGGRWRGGIMPMDAFEADGIYTLRFDIPGVDPDTVDLTVENGVLSVTAERHVEFTEDVTWLLRERPSGSHRRDVRLGRRLDAANISASYDNGVLTVTIPVREEAKPQKVSISSGAPEAITAGS